MRQRATEPSRYWNCTRLADFCSYTACRHRALTNRVHYRVRSYALCCLFISSSFECQQLFRMGVVLSGRLVSDTRTQGSTPPSPLHQVANLGRETSDRDCPSMAAPVQLAQRAQRRPPPFRHHDLINLSLKRTGIHTSVPHSRLRLPGAASGLSCLFNRRSGAH